MGGPRLLSVNLSGDGYVVYSQVGTSASGKNLLNGKNDVSIHKTVDFNKDEQVDAYYISDQQQIVIDEKFLAQVKNPRSTPATLQEKMDAEKEYKAGKLLAMKLYKTFRDALKEENKIRIEIDDRGDTFESTLTLYDSASRIVANIYLYHEDGEKVVTQFKLYCDNGVKVTYSDPQLLAPIQGELNALLRKQFESVLSNN